MFAVDLQEVVWKTEIVSINHDHSTACFCHKAIKRMSPGRFLCQPTLNNVIGKAICDNEVRYGDVVSLCLVLVKWDGAADVTISFVFFVSVLLCKLAK